jgi:hypothetical protein
LEDADGGSCFQNEASRGCVKSFIAQPNCVLPELAAAIGIRRRTTPHVKFGRRGRGNRSDSASRELVRLKLGRKEIAEAGREANERVSPSWCPYKEYPPTAVLRDRQAAKGARLTGHEE